jgi:hypothetical protein
VVESVLGSKIAKMETWHLQLKERCARLRGQLETGRREIPGVGQLKDEASEVELTAAELLEACRTYVDQLAKYQKDWTAMLRANDTRTRELQGELEVLAREHQSLVGNAVTPSRARSRSRSSAMGGDTLIDEADSDDDVFFDAVEAGEEAGAPIAASASPAAATSATTANAGTLRSSALGGEMVTVGAGPAVVRRTKIPLSPKLQLSLWSMIKSCVGKVCCQISDRRTRTRLCFCITCAFKSYRGESRCAVTHLANTVAVCRICRESPCQSTLTSQFRLPSACARTSSTASCSTARPRAPRPLNGWCGLPRSPRRALRPRRKNGLANPLTPFLARRTNWIAVLNLAGAL